MNPRYLEVMVDSWTANLSRPLHRTNGTRSSLTALLCDSGAIPDRQVEKAAGKEELGELRVTSLNMISQSCTK